MIVPEKLTNKYRSENRPEILITNNIMPWIKYFTSVKPGSIVSVKLLRLTVFTLTISINKFMSFSLQPKENLVAN